MGERDGGAAAEVMSKLDEALKMLDAFDTTPFGFVKGQIHRITNAVSSAKYILELQERAAARTQGSE